MRPVGQGLGGLRMNLDHDAVDAQRRGRARQRGDRFGHAGAVRGVDDDGQMRERAQDGSTPRSSVLRVIVSNVRMPRSQRMTLRLPRATMYSAAMSHSLTVEEVPA